MNKKLMTALGCLLMIGAAMVPGAIAHTLDNATEKKGATDPVWQSLPTTENPPASNDPSGWYDGGANTYAALASGDLTPDNTAQCAPLDPANGGNPLAHDACLVLLGPMNPSFLFDAGFALCDLEVLGDGRAQQGQDEDVVDAVPTPGTTDDGTWDDGGMGAVCHTHAEADTTHSGSQAGYYDIDGYNTGGCPDGRNAVAYDLVLGADIWISTSCDYTYDLHASGGLSVYLGCTSDALLTAEPLDVIGCTSDLAACISGSGGCAPVGAPTECGADRSADASGGFGRGGGRSGPGVPYPSAPYQDTAGNDCIDYASAAAFTWTGVDVVTNGSNVLSDSTVSAATHGWVSSITTP